MTDMDELKTAIQELQRSVYLVEVALQVMREEMNTHMRERAAERLALLDTVMSDG